MTKHRSNPDSFTNIPFVLEETNVESVTDIVSSDEIVSLLWMNNEH